MDPILSDQRRDTPPASTERRVGVFFLHVSTSGGTAVCRLAQEQRCSHVPSCGAGRFAREVLDAGRRWRRSTGGLVDLRPEVRQAVPVREHVSGGAQFQDTTVDASFAWAARGVGL